jgi:hypothetical protein
MVQLHLQASKGSLFPRAQGKNTHPKKICSFLGLPGEVRNLVYFYYFQEHYRCEIAAKGVNFTKTKAKVMKLCLGIVYKGGPIYKYSKAPKPEALTTVRISRCLGHYSRVHGIQTSWLGSLCALVLVCKQVHRESLVFMYHNTTFVFNAPSRITNFLEVLPKANLAHVTKLQLHYTTYGSPQLRVDCVWQERHLHSWTSACKSASKKLVQLQELEVWLHVKATPLFFDLRQAWLEPLLQFRRLTCVRQVKAGVEETKVSDQTTTTISNETDNLPPLKIAKIHFNTFWSKDHTLERNAVPSLVNANFDLHHIFAQAISQAILGASEEEAMADFKKAWEGKYQRWNNHLSYSYTTI